MYFSSFEAGKFQLQMTKNRTPTLVYLDPGMHPGHGDKGINDNEKSNISEIVFGDNNITPTPTP